MISNFKFISIFFLLLMLNACGSDSSSESENQTEGLAEEQVDKYPDDTYCASIDYKNPSTRSHGIYRLNVDVENHEVVKIHFPNGGWLDEDHFTAKQLDEDGTCSFTSDKNCNYKVEILGDECTFDQTQYKLTLQHCAKLNGITDTELKKYLDETRKLSTDSTVMDLCEILVQYIKDIRKINQDINALNNEMNEGYIQTVLFYTMHDNAICHQIIVKKHNKFYWLEVSGNEKCNTGTIKFNSSQSGWQVVAVKQNPDDNKLNGYKMKIQGSSNSLSQLNNEINTYCNIGN